MLKRIVVLAGLGLAVAACQDNGRYVGNGRSKAPIPAKTVSLMQSKGMRTSDPIIIRAFKKEAELEVWKRASDGRYALLKTYPICRWSGQLGPKIKEGDRQAPEGFYTITPARMNPNSSYFLSFDTGFPNAFDRANGRTGKYLMVHGACSSAGCYSMTDEQIAEIYAIGREAFAGGQRSFQFQAFPFRMTPENMAKHRLDPNIAFWRQLKEGYDHFEVTRQEPKVDVCGRRYVFNAKAANGSSLNPSAACPALTVEPSVAQAVAAKQHADNAKIADLLNKTSAIRLVYSDGGQHPSFTNKQAGLFAANSRTPAYDASLVSRPDALVAGPQEIVLEHAKSSGVGNLFASLSKPATPKPAQQETQAQAPVGSAVVAAGAQPPAPPARPVQVAEGAASTATAENSSFFSRMMSFTGHTEEPAADAIKTASTPAATPPATTTSSGTPAPAGILGPNMFGQLY